METLPSKRKTPVWLSEKTAKDESKSGVKVTNTQCTKKAVRKGRWRSVNEFRIAIETNCGAVAVYGHSADTGAAAAGITYMPDVTAEMSDASYWAKLYDNADEIILNQEEIKAFNKDTYAASGNMVMDLARILPR